MTVNGVNVYTLATVRCVDGRMRHPEPFSSRREANQWAAWGHLCAARHQVLASNVTGIAELYEWLRRYRPCCGLYDHNAEHLCGVPLYTGPICEERDWCLAPTTVAFYGAPGSGQTRVCLNGHHDTPPHILTPEEVR